MSNTEYQKGYRAGKRSKTNDSLQKERVYMKCLELVMESSPHWESSGLKVNTAGGYTALAKDFATESLRIINEELK